MIDRATPLEMAFALARSGQYATVELIKKRMNQTGYSATQVYGRELRRQLRDLIGVSRNPSLAPEGVVPVDRSRAFPG